MKKAAGRRSFYALFCLRAGGWVLRRPGGEQVLRLRARDGEFRAPAASRFPPDGEAASGGHISFCEERNVGKKVA